ncbi:MAG: hypothetical protein ACM3VS_08960 [Candidatus Dadabacteria bacterium]
MYGVTMELPWSLSMHTPCILHTEAMQKQGNFNTSGRYKGLASGVVNQ